MYLISAFYSFFSIDESKLPQVSADLQALAKDNQVDGLVIIATEGVNGTVSGPDLEVSLPGMKRFWQELEKYFGAHDYHLKLSHSEKRPFLRFRVRVREEIVTSGCGLLNPKCEGHLSVDDWHNWLTDGRDCTLIDTRNNYESEIGTFKGSICPDINTFQEFGNYLDEANLPKDKPVLMFCTGGIRCEKARDIMMDKGYPEVYHLSGGILAYMEKYPEGTFDGECFVFDRRVAVNANLEPTKVYGLCPHTGEPSKVEIVCNCCGKAAKVHPDCLSKSDLVTCSKDCAERYRRKMAKQAA